MVRKNILFAQIIELIRAGLPEYRDRKLVSKAQREFYLAVDDLFEGAEDDSFVVPDDEEEDEPCDSEASYRPEEEEEEAEMTDEDEDDEDEEEDEDPEADYDSGEL